MHRVNKTLVHRMVHTHFNSSITQWAQNINTINHGTLSLKMVSEWWMKKGAVSREPSHFIDYFEQHKHLVAVESFNCVNHAWLLSEWSIFIVRHPSSVCHAEALWLSYFSIHQSQHRSSLIMVRSHTKSNTEYTFSLLLPTELTSGLAAWLRVHVDQLASTVFVSNGIWKDLKSLSFIISVLHIFYIGVMINPLKQTKVILSE